MSQAAENVQPPASPPSAAEPPWPRWAGTAAFVAAVLVGGWLRLRVLDLKPLHSDEGVNGWFLMRLYDGLREFGNWRVNYRYDPTNYHGPFLYFAGLLPFFGGGPSNTTLRLCMALAGTGCIGILWVARRWLGWAGLALAAWLIALSLPLVYFSRTAIHEIYVAFFSLSAVICFARCYAGSWKPGATAFRANWLLFGCVSAALLFTNKETAVITFASFAGAAFVAWFFSRTASEEIPPPSRAERRSKKDKEKETDAPAGLGGLASFLRWGAAAAIALGPAGVLWHFVKGSRPWRLLSGESRTWIWVALAFGVVSAAGWIAGTRGETFAIGPRLRRAGRILLTAVGGIAFLGLGPLLLLRYVSGVLDLSGRRAEKAEAAGKPSRLSVAVEALAGRTTVLQEKMERKFVSTFEDLSDYALAYAWAIALVVILFTSFFTNLRGAWDMFATYGTWVNRGHEGAGHEKPFGYWIELLWEFDAPILLAGLLGTAVVLYRRDRFGLFVASWAWSQWLVYSVISYKTPWLNLNFTVPLALTAGFAAREVAERFGNAARGIPRAAFALAIPAAVVLWPVPAGKVISPKDPDRTVSWWRLNWDVNFVHYDDDRYPIIYVQTVREFEGLVDRVAKLLEVHGDELGVWVTSGDYWPMPFYLRRWDDTVGYYQGKIPDGTTPSVVVSASTQEDELRERVAGYRRVPFMLRPGIALTLFAEPAVYDPVFGPPPGEAVPEPPPEDPSLLEAGLFAEYRYGLGCTGELLASRVDASPAYGGEQREFRAPICVTWRGFVSIEEEGEYAFGTLSDDGSWVYLDGKLAVENGGTHGPIEREGVLRRLSPGLHPIEVRYFDAGGGATLEAWIRRRDQSRVPLAESGLVHDVRWLEPVRKAEPAQREASAQGEGRAASGRLTP